MSISGNLVASVFVRRPTPPGFIQGWTAGLDYGTEGTYYVDPINGSDANVGSFAAPFATINHATTQLAGVGGKVKLIGDGVKFREQVPLRAGAANSPIVIEPYSTHVPIWTGGEQLTGWVQCTAADEAIVGPNYASVYKVVNIPNTSFPESDPNLAHIFEGSTMLNVSVSWEGNTLGDKFYTTDLAQGWTADSVQVNASNQIQSYTDASVSTLYTAAQIEAATLVGMRQGNNAFETTIASVVGDVITPTDQTQIYETNASKDKFILRNIIPAIEQGQWAFYNNGNGTSNLYIWPNNPANVTSEIEICARKNCLYSGSTPIGEWEVHGIDFRQVATRLDADGAFIYMGGYSSIVHNVVIKNCRFYGATINNSSKNGLLTLAGVASSLVENCTIENAQNTWGMQVFGQFTNEGPGTEFCFNNVVRRNHFKKSAQTPIWTAGQASFVFAHNKIEETGLGAHGNKSSLYAQTKDALFWGNTFINCDGYLTWQRASRLYLLFNHAPATRQATTSGARAMVDQNGDFAPSEWENENGECLILNNTLWSQPVTFLTPTAQKNSITLGHTGNPSVTFVMKNNICHGVIENVAGRITTSQNNWDTHDGGVFTVNDVAMPKADYTDPSTGDFTLTAGATIRAETGDSIATEIAALQTKFGALFDDWTLDALGNTIDHANPRIGAVVDYDYSTLRGSSAYQTFA